jgi:hypothetical protein
MAKPIKILDLHHQLDRLRTLKMSHEDSGKIYTALRDYVVDYEEINQVCAIHLSPSLKHAPDTNSCFA